MVCRSNASTSTLFRRAVISPSAMAPCASHSLKGATAPACPSTFLLRSLAEEYGERAICVILSGTGAAGSLGLKAVKEKGRPRYRPGPRRS